MRHLVTDQPCRRSAARIVLTQSLSYTHLRIYYCPKCPLPSSLLPLLLLSFLPSSSPLFPPCPHLIPFSSLFPPLFCRVRYLFKRCFVMICTFFPRIRSNNSPFSPFFAFQLTKRSNKRDGRAGYFPNPISKTIGQGIACMINVMKIWPLMRVLLPY